jgi:hypothetical protein
MKQGDIFIQIIHEVTGKPKEFAAEMLEIFKSMIPGPTKFDEEISDEEAESLLIELRKEKEGIAKFIIDGYLRFFLRKSPPSGSA